MTADSLQQCQLIASIDEKATNEQKMLNELHRLREEVLRLQQYEVDSDNAAQFIASKGLKYEYMNFVLKKQAAQKPNLYVVGEE